MPRIIALVLALAAVGCSANAPREGQGPSIPEHRTGAKIDVVTTFSTLNSFVQGVGGDRVEVANLVPIGASPEDYQPSPQDIATLSRAQLVVENGAGIEAWLQHTIQSAGNPNMKVVVLSDGLPKIDHNPHLWMDPVLARAYVAKILNALVRMDPAHKSTYEANAKAYGAQLAALQHWIAGRIASIPPKHRAMIVFHNAWSYYNRRFGIATIGVIELSPGQYPNPAYIGRLVELARKHQVRAVFSEPEYSAKLAQTLARSAGIHIVSNLYDDSVGNDPRVHDYTSMLRYDTDVIVQALK
jgi:ABC-type Zn uptake system ZnuABC Zn-binding protein ZnuA